MGFRAVFLLKSYIFACRRGGQWNFYGVFRLLDASERKAVKESFRYAVDRSVIHERTVDRLNFVM